MEIIRSKQESDVLKQLKHPNIVAYKESFLEKGRIVIIMEYCEGGDLSKLIKKNSEIELHFSEPQAIIWFYQLAKALEVIHSLNILHRDIKSSNIFLSKDGSLKLGDFGISKIMNNSCDVAHTLVGTPLYMSPELCSNQPYASKSDIWALGCVFYEICALHQPFVSPSLLALISKITKEHPDSLPERYSNTLKDLIFSMLVKDPILRISTSELVHHSIFTEYFFNPIQSIEHLYTDSRESFLNPLELCNQEACLSTDSLYKNANYSNPSSIDENDIPQDERSDDENVIIQSSNNSLIIGKTGVIESRKGKTENNIIDFKKSEAMKKFGVTEYLEIYEFLKKQRILQSYDDIVIFIQIFSNLIERYNSHDLRDFILIDQIIYYEDNL